jgi:hypothetical protein
MNKVVRLTESDLNRLVKRVLNESHEERGDRYMFFSNLEQMKRQCEILLEKDRGMIEEILDDGHDWAQDHIAESKNNMDEVFDFMMNHIEGDGDGDGDGDGEQVINDTSFDNVVGEGRKKAGTKLCARGKAAAKSKFKVYPSAYGNGFAVQVCKGRMKGLDGKKRCSPPYC